MGEGFHKLIFLCYVCYYLLYGFKISMSLMYNLLLVSNLITCQLNIFVFTLHDFMPCFLAKNVCVIIVNLSNQMSTKIFYNS